MYEETNEAKDMKIGANVFEETHGAKDLKMGAYVYKETYDFDVPLMVSGCRPVTMSVSSFLQLTIASGNSVSFLKGSPADQSSCFQTKTEMRIQDR